MNTNAPLRMAVLVLAIGMIAAACGTSEESGATIVILVEPDPDDSPAPLPLEPLVDRVPDSPTDHESYEPGNNAVDLTGGTARLG